MATNSTSSNTTIFIPINFVSNTLAGSKVKVKSSDGQITEKEITLGELNSNDVEVRSGLQMGETICN